MFEVRALNKSFNVKRIHRGFKAKYLAETFAYCRYPRYVINQYMRKL